MRTTRWTALVVLCAAFGCTSGGNDPDDAGRSDASCSADSECDDGAFCNGEETCVAGSCTPGTAPCPAACDETMDRCGGACEDMDGDGFPAASCGGTDCDDSDPNRSPGLTEVCDPTNRDEDCDPRTYGFRDADMDGEGDARCCNTDDAGDVLCGLDCDDMRPGVSSTSTEACDGFDNDCDGTVDEGVMLTFYPDMDGDDFGDDAMGAVTACAAPEGYSANVGDCDDTASDVNPGLGERCDRPAAGEEPVDENCNGMANEDCDCTEGTTRPCMLPGLCASGVEICDSGTWSTTCSIEPEVDTMCDGIDTDCDGRVDEGLVVTCYRDDDNDTYPGPAAGAEPRCPVSGRGEVGGCPPGYTNVAPTMATRDCDDTRSTVSPGAEEVCVEGAMVDRDDDCDGTVDEGVAVTCWVDSDNDLYPAAGASQDRCVVGGRETAGGCPFNTTNRNPTMGVDCDDSAFNVNPAAMELCDGESVDENCDGMANPPAICSCSGNVMRACSAGGLFGVCASGTQTCMSGAWSACSTPPGTESGCNGADDDCDGTTDEGFTVTCYTDLDHDGYAPSGATATQRCSCGAGSNTTDRAPTGMNVDCNDGNAAIHPGATEICDRLDNDCSSGGGAEVLEDADNDGYARPTAACTGGFPKTDCNDADSRFRPSQPTYFTSGGCVGHVSVKSCAAGTLCDCSNGFSLPLNFDFDCDGTVEPQPEALCRPAGGTFECNTTRGCTGAGPTDPPTMGNCGQSVPWSNCFCNTSGTLDVCNELTFIGISPPRRLMGTVGCQ
ncbi:MAG: putative metal-binding motif-containing protein [Polyangiales bacterium]